ncbi:MAG: hypothetical protein JF588_20160 [Caulobacterales bacterium]|nr:hypothetical protein [Caulobacterales bacterium]
MSARLIALALALAVTALPAGAETPAAEPLTVTNASARLAECALVVDGHTRTMLKLHVGKSWSDSFRPNQDLRLVCERSRKLFFGPLKAGSTYRLVGDGRWLELADGPAE